MMTLSEILEQVEQWPKDKQREFYQLLQTVQMSGRPVDQCANKVFQEIGKAPITKH